MLESIQKIKNYQLYSFMEQINEKFFSVSFAVFDSGSIRVNISQYKSLYKKHLLKSINFTSENFTNLISIKDSMFEGNEFDIKIAFENALEEFLELKK